MLCWRSLPRLISFRCPPPSLLLGLREKRQSTRCGGITLKLLHQNLANIKASLSLIIFFGLTVRFAGLSSLTRGRTRARPWQGKRAAFSTRPICLILSFISATLSSHFLYFSFMVISLSLSFIILTQWLCMYFMNLFVFAHEVMFCCLLVVEYSVLGTVFVNVLAEILWGMLQMSFAHRGFELLSGAWGPLNQGWP